MPRIASHENNTTRVTITVDKKVIDEIRKTTKNVSSFFNEAAKVQIHEKKKQSLGEFLRSIKKVTPVEPSLVTIRRGRDEELA